MDSSGVRWLRWAFNCKNWKPVATEWTHANKCIQREEVQRIEQFVFQAPAISSLVGRLMLRRGIQTAAGLDNADIKLSRTSEGRPFMPGLSDIDINVSHDGDWVVLALERGCNVGTDIMSMKRPINKDLDEYFRLMRKQFTEGEWEQINNSANKLHAFYRFWCLKESYVKAIGVGLNLNLQTIDFQTKEELSLTHPVRSTTMKLLKEASCQDSWLFEEVLVDTNHCVATCYDAKSEHATDKPYTADCERFFTILNVENLLCLEAITDDISESLWDQFNSKKYSAK